MTFKDWLLDEHDLDITQMSIPELEPYYQEYLKIYSIDI